MSNNTMSNNIGSNNIDFRHVFPRRLSRLVVFGLAFIFMATQFPGTAAAQQPGDAENVIIHGRVILPDGTTPEQYHLSRIVTTLPRNSGFPFFQTSGGEQSIRSSNFRHGEPFEVEASVGAEVRLMAGTADGFSFTHDGPRVFARAFAHFVPRHTPEVRVYPQDVFVSQPHTFLVEKEHEEVVLRLEKATPVTGKLRYDDGTPAIGVVVSAWQPAPSARDADNPANIPRIWRETAIGMTVVTDTEGNFEFRLWAGEFTLVTSGGPWAEPVTQTIVVERGKPVEVELTLPTPLRINVVMPDGEPAGNFRLTHLAAYRPVWQTGRFVPEVSFTTVYDARSWRDRRPFVVPERPIAVHLCNEENFVAVMTECHEFGIVRKLEPELMGQELTLTLRPTIEGTVKLVDQSKHPVADQEVSIDMRIMKQDHNGYTERSGSFAPYLWFRTDADGRMDFKVPVFEGIDDTIWLSFQRGASGWHGGSGGSTSRSPGGLLGSLDTWLFQHPRRDEHFKHFRPPADGKAFDLGVMEIER